ncbi:hypothetical protein TNCV_3601471 [Trichonephila clavipes]|nr:hypothetical protein TNCV_3601471 [Trichonephila clavipes]
MYLSSGSAFFAHVNVFFHDGKPLPIELSIDTIPRVGSDSEVSCITINHAGLTSTAKDIRPNKYINARLRLVHHYSKVYPWNSCYFANLAFFTCQRVSSWWPACSHRNVHCQHLRGWEGSGSGFITVYHSNLITTSKDYRANKYINERLSLKHLILVSVPLQYLSFCVRSKFSHLAQGNRGFILVKGLDQRKIFEKLVLLTINLLTLPKFQDSNECILPDQLHDEVHKYFVISKCTSVKSYWFVRYQQDRT